MSRLHSPLPLPHFASPMCVWCITMCVHISACECMCPWALVHMQVRERPHLTSFEAGSLPFATVSTSTADLCPSGILVCDRVSAIRHCEHQHSWPMAFRGFSFLCLWSLHTSTGITDACKHPIDSFHGFWRFELRSSRMCDPRLCSEPSPQASFSLF